jgi:Leucine rich repeat
MTEEPTLQSSESTTPQREHRRLQFNLQTLFVLTLAIGTALGLVFNERRKNATIHARIQTNLDALKSFGCRLKVDRDGSFRPSLFDWLIDREDFGVVTWLSGQDSSMTDVRLKHVKELPQLVELILAYQKITDAGLPHLKGLANLEYLSLIDTEITDIGLEHLKVLTKLKYLDLSETRITDVGLVHLKDLRNLNYLYLWETEVTDAGLVHFKNLTNLQTLSLQKTRITLKGLADLQKAIPNCRIYHDTKY